MIEKGKSTVGLVCDTPHCFQDVLGESEDECLSIASGMGWTIGDTHQCPECAAGHTPKLFGAASVPHPIRKGDAVKDNYGRVVGVAQADAKAGEFVSVELDLDYVADKSKEANRNAKSDQFKNQRKAQGASVPGVFATAKENAAVERSTAKVKVGMPTRPKPADKEQLAKHNLRHRIKFEDLDELFGHINMKVPDDVDN